MNHSEKTDMIAAALSGVHKDLRNPRKDSRADAGKFSYRFLGLPGLIDHAKKALDAHGVAVIQDVKGGAGFVEVSTVLMHLAGQYVEVGPLFLPASGDAQQYGSAITYARRYALAAALNLAADEDDDAAKASRKTSAPSGEAVPPSLGTATGAVSSASSSTVPATSADETSAGEGVAAGGFGEGAPAVTRNYLTKEDQALLRVSYGSPKAAIQAYRYRFGDRIRALSDITYEMRDEIEAAS